MKVIVLGSGLLGVSSAYYLSQLGHEVTVVDRQATPAAETSFANGGQISVSHAEPWANPSAPLKVLKWLGQEDAPLLFRLRADAYVMAMGSFSPLYADALGLRLPIYPAKGYSVTLPVKDASKAYQVSLTDDEYKLVFSRLTGPHGDRLRIAGTAELNGYDRDLNRVRCEAIVRRVEQLFPGAGHLDQASFWTGLRPATPSNVPLIGRTRYPNLYLNTGHGTLGWTHACGSGKSIARIVSGLKPEVDFDFMG